MNLSPGSILKDRYKVIDKHNFGGMGKTYIAEDLESGDKVILKLLIFSEMENWKAFDLFEREVKTLKGLNFKFIPSYIDNFEIDDEDNVYYFLVQKYIEGRNLYDIITEGKRYSFKDVLSIFKSLLIILKYLHNLNPAVIHRDIQPKNIIIGEDKQVYLVDFGSVGQIAKNTIAAGNTFVGTIGYFPQEQMMGKVFPSSDIYSLAMCIIFILTGKNPSDLPMKMGKVDYHPYVEIPYEFMKILDKMQNYVPEKRYQSADKILADITANMNKKPISKKYNGIYPTKKVNSKDNIDELTEKGLENPAEYKTFHPIVAVIAAILLFVSIVLAMMMINGFSDSLCNYNKKEKSYGYGN